MHFIELTGMNERTIYVRADFMISFTAYNHDDTGERYTKVWVANRDLPYLVTELPEEVFRRCEAALNTPNPSQL